MRLNAFFHRTGGESSSISFHGLVLTISWIFIMIQNDSSHAIAWSAEWVKLEPKQRVAPRRSGHTAFVADKTTPYVFGGYAEETAGQEADKPKRYVVNDLWRWTGDEWELTPTTGDIPGPRLASATTTVGGDVKAYLFGGWDPQTEGTGGVILDTVHELDIDTLSWTKLDNVTIPGGPTSRHVAVATKNGKILIHNHRCIDFVLLFDPTTLTFTEQETTGPCPSSRGLHAATMVDLENSSETLCIFGGAAQDQKMSNEVFLLDTTTWKWTEVDTGDDCPCPRASPCLVTVGPNSVVVFGGATFGEMGLVPCGDTWVLSLDTGKWRLLCDGTTSTTEDDSSSSISPPPRNAATLSETGTGGFLLTGGWAPFKETWDDCYELRVESKDI